MAGHGSEKKLVRTYTGPRKDIIDLTAPNSLPLTEQELASDQLVIVEQEGNSCTMVSAGVIRDYQEESERVLGPIVDRILAQKRKKSSRKSHTKGRK